MNRDTLQNVLRAAGAVADKSGVFRAPAEQRLTFYIGDTRGLVVSAIEEVRFEDAFVVLKAKELGQLFAEYTAIYAVSTQAPKDGNAPKKAGFA